MSVEQWKSLFDVAAVALLFLTFVAGAGVLFTGNVINKQQSEQLRRFDKDLRDKDLEIARVNERAAEANRIAEGERLARIKLETKIAPRFLVPEQIAKLAQLLRPSKVKLLGLYVYGGTPEMMRLSGQIGQALKSAGWNFEGWTVTSTIAVAGILVDVRVDADRQTEDDAKLIAASLRAVDIEATYLPERFTKENANPGMLTGPVWNVDKVGLIRLHLGVKP